MLQFSANLSLLFTELPLIERFKAARQAGFEAVEIQFPYCLSIDQIAEQLEQHALKLVLFNVDADTLLAGGEGLAAVPGKETQFRQAVEQAALYARTLKPVAINILPGRCLDTSQQPQYLSTLKQNLRYAADQFADIEVRTVFEAVNTIDMPGFIIHSSQQMLAILAELQHPNLFMQVDIYHMSRMQENCADLFRHYLDKIGHIQFADCPGRGEPGSGEIDFDRLFKQIAESGYRGWTGAEFKPTTPRTETALRALHRFQKIAV